MTGALALLLPFAVPAAAQSLDAAGGCATVKAPPAELSAWTSPVTVVTANDAAGLGDARLRVGQAAELVLHPMGALTLPVPAGHEGGNGGLAAIAIPRTGTYRVALGSAGWVDLVSAGKAIPSTAHGHGPGCTGIRKLVEFELTRGLYTVVISGNLEPRTTLLLAPRPKDAPAIHP
jgi:hypothetical protein